MRTLLIIILVMCLLTEPSMAPEPRPWTQEEKIAFFAVGIAVIAFLPSVLRYFFRVR